MNTKDIISQNTQSTVVAEYVREEREIETGYQSESDLRALLNLNPFSQIANILVS